MSNDAELETLRAGVTCTAVLENLVAGWECDRRQSTRHALKYRRGAGEVLIVNHDGRGWWGPFSDAKGDVFSLVQHLEPGLNFGQVRQTLRRLLGMALPPAKPRSERRHTHPERPPLERWDARPHLRLRSPAWTYLTVERALPSDLLRKATTEDALREGPYASAWFAHRMDGLVCHVDIRGPTYKGSLTGGEKTLFRFGGTNRRWSRLVIAEAPIDALNIATIERRRSDTLYSATSGGMGPAPVVLLKAMPSIPEALVVSAVDADAAGDHYATHHQELANRNGVAFERLRPLEGLDWNDVLRQRRQP